MVKHSPSAKNFNMELIYAEISAFVCTNIATVVSTRLTKNTHIISGTAVVAAVSSASIVWVFTRFYHRKTEEGAGAKDIAHDIKYFTPFAAFAGFCIYDPTLYFLSDYMQNHAVPTQLAVISAQVVAFGLFLGSMNIYRTILIKKNVKQL